MGSSRRHWDNVYSTKAETAVSWFQPHLARSLELIGSASPDHKASVIDIGGGASTLVDDLLVLGHSDITVLDISERALERTKARLGPEANGVKWIVADITRWSSERKWDIWHDRAVLHFLTERTQQEAYVAALFAATSPGSTVIISTSALDGPERCSGLLLQRYSPEMLSGLLGSSFVLDDHSKEIFETPLGSEQTFLYASFRRR